ncbi:MAG: hypothetical protein F6K04_05975 [Leptolyngbya sp. SIO4C5]|uniref:hypothetical protein n=1 Tax=Sphaerothrix gracilis TaxID=3151835 RepID=UPI0013BF64B8|nr:hypothetical protein [Leptolyngbya sp. SIO4C5]
MEIAWGSLDRPLSSSFNQLHSFSKAWAKRYIQQVKDNTGHSPKYVVTENDARQAIADYLNQELRTVSAQAWTQTEALLSKEVVRHQIKGELIDPWAIAKDVYVIYEKAFAAYANGTAPERFATDLAPELGLIRAKYTLVDPRVIGFVSMQFHYTGQLLLQLIAVERQDVLRLYFKAIDDHLYMPLQRAYSAAASHPMSSPVLKVVQILLPHSSAIAQKVVNQIMQANPHHRCYSGPLSNPTVRTSSLRDAEMFQTYLWVCLLENNVSAVQQELFPLCVMLYPTLNVRWGLVRQMLVLLEKHFGILLDEAQMALLKPYLSATNAMFAADVFEEAA